MTGFWKTTLRSAVVAVVLMFVLVVWLGWFEWAYFGACVIAGCVVGVIEGLRR